MLESRYVPAASEIYFFSNTTMKKGNGVVLLLFSHSKAKTLKWKDQVQSKERYKKVGQVKEFSIHDNELRMEVYMDYLRQVQHVEHVDNQRIMNVLCITTGRKCMTAALVRFTLAHRLIAQMLSCYCTVKEIQYEAKELLRSYCCRCTECAQCQWC